MCGIAGFVDYSGQSRIDPTQTVDAMRDALLHRGPDAGGSILEAEGRVALGHRRLSIIDLSEAGAQPMESPSGRYVIVFNGEIYNFLDLRARLATLGVSFRGQSDTEVLLSSIEQFGLIPTLRQANGMFAFAMYDRAEKQIVIARDRLGKKPLYLGVKGGVLAFGSELKALRQHPEFASPEIDREAVSQFARLGYIPSPLSIFKDIGKLQPGCFAAFSVQGKAPVLEDITGAAEPYWSMLEAANSGIMDRYESEELALDDLERRLGEAVGQRLIADVPIGAFLSGGIDSSLVCSLMQERLVGDAKTYTVSFEEAEYDEAEDAADLARYIGTDHTQLSLSPEAALDAVGTMPQIFDEPFADPSQIPSYLISRLIRSEVTVAISGDGGDEFFAGYRRYAQMASMERLAGKLPSAVRHTANALPFGLIAAASKAGSLIGGGERRQELSGDRIDKILNVLAAPDFRHRYERFISQWMLSPASNCHGSAVPSPYVTQQTPDDADMLEQMMFLDAMCYLPDDVLVKVDRTSMAASLEVRSPLLDYNVIEAAWRMPNSLRMAAGEPGKVALRRLLARRVPDRLIDRPKRGFGIPINVWLRGPLRDLAEEHLSVARLQDVGHFNCHEVRRKWDEHLSGRRNWGFHLWTCISFSMWHQHWMST